MRTQTTPTTKFGRTRWKPDPRRHTVRLVFIHTGILFTYTPARNRLLLGGFSHTTGQAHYFIPQYSTKQVRTGLITAYRIYYQNFLLYFGADEISENFLNIFLKLSHGMLWAYSIGYDLLHILPFSLVPSQSFLSFFPANLFTFFSASFVSSDLCSHSKSFISHQNDMVELFKFLFSNTSIKESYISVPPYALNAIKFYFIH